LNSTEASASTLESELADDSWALAELATSAKRVLTPDLLMDAWSAITVRAGVLLRDEWRSDSVARLRQLDAEVCELLTSEPNGSLLWLVHHNTSEPQNYSVLHALLVTAVCQLASDYLTNMPADMKTSARLAALTMNLSITRLQDELVRQQTPLTEEQRAALSDHGTRAAASLREGGVSDPLWLGAVERHHNVTAGGLASLEPMMQIARLLQKADIFAARLSPRGVRHALAANDAAKGIYLNEQKAPDEIGGAIIKALGIYIPGSSVLLRSGEVAVVVRRGLLANQPMVASITNPQGMPLSHPQLRDCQQSAHAVASGLPPHQRRVRVALGQLLRLAKQTDI
jgi:HD-GYP domain-containing protein (c-di-GMP phosphodiesterase class II)